MEGKRGIEEYLIDSSDDESVSCGSCFTDQETTYLAHLIDSNINQYMKMY
jgi:hypothetical protein